MCPRSGRSNRRCAAMGGIPSSPWRTTFTPEPRTFEWAASWSKVRRGARVERQLETKGARRLVTGLPAEPALCARNDKCAGRNQSLLTATFQHGRPPWRGGAAVPSPQVRLEGAVDEV